MSTQISHVGIGHNDGPVLLCASCESVKHPLAGLTFTKCWKLIKARSTRSERVLFAGYVIAGTHHRPDVIRALSEFSGVSVRAATKWVDGDSFPKSEMDFFVALMEFHNDDWRAIVNAFDAYVRGKILWGLK